MIARILAVIAIALCMHTEVQAGGHLEDEVLQLINEYRIQHRLQPLQEVGDIADAAYKHSKDMGKHKVPFGHDGFDERTGKLLDKIKGSNAAAENVAYGPRTAEKVVDLWLHSPGHRKNIVGNYNLTGIGIYQSRDGTLYYTQIFIHKK